jgi:pilus assembly protein Flp/PilA
MMRNIMIYSYTYSHMLSRLLNRRNERGATMVEYAIIIAVLSIAAVALIALLGGQVQAAFEGVTAVIEANTPPPNSG